MDRPFLFQSSNKLIPNRLVSSSSSPYPRLISSSPSPWTTPATGPALPLPVRVVSLISGSMSSRKRRALVALQLREKGKWVLGKKEEDQLPQVPKPTPARAGTKAGVGKAAAGRKAGARTSGAGKAAAVPPMKRSSRRFQEEVSSSGSSDVGPAPGFQGPPPGFSGNPTPAKAAALVTPKK